MISAQLNRRTVLAGIPMLGACTAGCTSTGKYSGRQGPSLPRPDSTPKLGNWKDFSYTEKVFDNLREFAIEMVPLIRRAFMGGDRIAEVVLSDPPVMVEGHNDWSGEWQGDFLGFNPDGSKQYDIHVRHVWESMVSHIRHGRTYYVQPVHMVHHNGQSLVYEQAFDVVFRQRLFGVVFNEREGAVPHVGYVVGPGHLVWVREGIVFSEWLRDLVGGRRLYSIRGFFVDPDYRDDVAHLRWMEGWYYSV